MARGIMGFCPKRTSYRGSKDPLSSIVTLNKAAAFAKFSALLPNEQFSYVEIQNV